VVEHDVAGRRGGLVGAEHDRAREAEAVGRRGGHPHVVALAAAAGDERLAPLLDRVGAEVLELAGLVPAPGQPGGVVALHPQRAGLHAEAGAEALHRLERRGQVGEREPPIEGVRHRP
jgi:hypothetical protein